MGRSQRNKGAAAEREVARFLRDHLGDGWTVTRSAIGESTHDLQVLDPGGRPWRYAAEVKRYRAFSVGEACRGSARGRAWWAQAERQAAHVGRSPLLITRGDRRPWWIWRHSPAGLVPRWRGAPCVVCIGPVYGVRLVDLEPGELC